MKHIFLYACLLLALIQVSFAQKVISITIDGTINPVAADYVHNSIKKAADVKAECLIIHLNTPGGLLQSTRTIVSNMLESPVPVIVYIAPAGAHAGSAGVFITLAADIAAMAPGTNIGAAHPVNLQGGMDTVMNEKATNDAAAFIRTIAQKRQRNFQWAEDAVRKSLSITETEAMNTKVVDLLAKDDRELLALVDGKTVEVSTGTRTLHTKNASVETIEMGFFEKILNIISDPNVAYILFMLGVYGLMFELYSPGAIFPGIIGVIALILALYTMQTLPINYAGLALIIFAVILFLLEVKIVSHGLLAIGGTVSLLLGSMMLIKSDSSLEFIKLSMSVVIPCVVVTACFFLVIIGMGLKAQRRKTVTGSSAMIGKTGVSIETLDPLGTVVLQGEIWNAASVSGRIDKGEKIRVVAIEHLQLQVESFNS